MHAHAPIRQPSTWLTPGKKLSHFPRVNAYDPTRAPLVTGKSNGPAQCGRKPGIVSEPATGFLCATLVPKGHPSDSRAVLPVLDKVQRATERVQTGPRRPLHSVAGDLGLHDTVLRQALHERSMLTVGIPKRVEPIKANPSAEEVRDMLHAAGFHRQRTPHHVHVACASGESRPVVESHIATLLWRGAGQGRYKGLAGAVGQQGMTVMAHNGAVGVRSRQQQLSKRARKFRRLLGGKPPKVNQISELKN